ncbi:unnamed protein product [marine sediment metagenome]|uniref:Uncharacterized protein n=1 Tax=marine sediment metagenome TaxID=412755 RepID=X0W897_9ZZZZ
MIWLRERALGEDLGTVTLAHLDRFVNAVDHPPAAKHFSAVAVLCSSLAEAELESAPTETPNGYRVIILVVPELRNVYTDVFEAVHNSVASRAGNNEGAS